MPYTLLLGQIFFIIIVFCFFTLLTLLRSSNFSNFLGEEILPQSALFLQVSGFSSLILLV